MTENSWIKTIRKGYAPLEKLDGLLGVWERIPGIAKSGMRMLGFYVFVQVGFGFLAQALEVGRDYWYFVVIASLIVTIVAGLLFEHFVFAGASLRGVATVTARPTAVSPEEQPIVVPEDRLLVEIIETIEAGDSIVERIEGRGRTENDAWKLWLKEAEMFVEAHFDRSQLSDFKTARHPVRDLQGGTFTAADWKIVRNMMAKLEVLKRFKGEVEEEAHAGDVAAEGVLVAPLPPPSLDGQLREFIKEGNGLKQRCIDLTEPPPAALIENWRVRVKDFLEKNFGGYAQLWDGFGTPKRRFTGVTSHRNSKRLWEAMQLRLERLEEIEKEAR